MQLDGNDFSAVRESALKLLSRRDHSSKELTGKLLQRGFDADSIEAVLDELTHAGLHSERRYAESYARQRAMKGYGPLRIRAELSERGIDRDLVNQALNELNIDFTELAHRFYRRKYHKPVQDYQEKARRSQAMARRGFSREHLRGLFDID